MKSGLFFGGALWSILFWFVSCGEALAAPQDIILSEIQVAGETAADEFFELYNSGTTEINLKHYRFGTINPADNSEKDIIKSFSKTSFLLQPKQYYLWANSKGEFSSFADTTTTSGLTPKKTFGLFYSETAQSPYAIVDSFSWDADPRENMSAERDPATPAWQFTNTPTPKNSRGETYQRRASCLNNLPQTPLRFNELFPNPKNEADEFIELYNKSDAPVRLEHWKIKDKTKTVLLSADDSVPPHALFLIPKAASEIELNNSDERITLIDPTDTLIDEVCYGKTKEGVSLNYTPGGWRGGTPTPGAANQLNTLPETKEKVPKKGYRGVPVAFDARGQDADGDPLKYTWNFGDNHKSYKGKTSHTYEKTGTYPVTLTTTDGSDDVVETFTLKIESFPEPDVRITALVPNPSGKDTENEWILLENRGKKAVDLKGFGIATGWKKLANHPIRESFVIAPKSEARLTREFSLFTLPNEKGRIELRAPDGKVLQDIKYKLEKSAEEDAVYFKKKGKRWAWRPGDNAVEPAAPGPIAEEDVETSETIPEDTPSEPAPVEEPEKEVLGAAVVADTPNRNYLKLLNYGTGVALPPDITLSFPDSTTSLDGATEREHYAVTFVKAVFTDVNTALNELQNEAE